MSEDRGPGEGGRRGWMRDDPELALWMKDDGDVLEERGGDEPVAAEQFDGVDV